LASPAGALARREATVNNLTEDDKIMLCIVGAFGAAVVLLAPVYNGSAVSLR
jgi:aspartate aminotransferase-like enzyme